MDAQLVRCAGLLTWCWAGNWELEVCHTQIVPDEEVPMQPSAPCHHYAITMPSPDRHHCHPHAITMPSAPCHHYAITMPSLCHRHHASSTMPAAPCHHYLQLCLYVFDGAVGRCADLQCTQEDISAVLAEWSNTCNLILTTGASTKHKYKHMLSHCALSTEPDFELI